MMCISSIYGFEAICSIIPIFSPLKVGCKCISIISWGGCTKIGGHLGVPLQFSTPLPPKMYKIWKTHCDIKILIQKIYFTTDYAIYNDLGIINGFLMYILTICVPPTPKIKKKRLNYSSIFVLRNKMCVWHFWAHWR